MWRLNGKCGLMLMLMLMLEEAHIPAAAAVASVGVALFSTAGTEAAAPCVSLAATSVLPRRPSAATAVQPVEKEE